VKYFFLFFLIFSFVGNAQQKNELSNLQDSLTPVIVQAFSQQVKWKEAAAAIAIINNADLGMYAPNSLLPSFNKLSGVRMEERSPGSYRLSIRGSLLRSPFGVRNTKIYWNDLPLSDATGNTYLNLVDLSQMSAIEIIKGPASSVYGAGTGGVVLLQSGLTHSADTINRTIQAGVEFGSFNLFKEQLSWKKQSKHFNSCLSESYLQSDGYRQQSALKKLNLLYQASLEWKQHQFDFLGWYTNMYYQTPGGITLAQMQINPTLARQPTASLPGAIQQQTAIYNKTVFAGLKDQWKISKNKQLISFVSINNTRFKNPFITNYEYRNETNASVGSKFVVQSTSNNFQWVSGFEWLYNHSTITDFGNKKGIPDTLQLDDRVTANQWSVYTQIQQLLFGQLHLNAGLSINQQQFHYQRISDPLASSQSKSTQIVPAPRFSLLYDINSSIAVYGLLAYGFSPPSLSEVRPSDGNYYGELAPEKGWNWEMGLKGFLWKNKLQFDFAYYHFQLKDAIVRRNNAAGAEYFINAGSAMQQGIEATVHATILKSKMGFLNQAIIWSSYSFQPYHFINYSQGSISYSGNAMTGVPKNISVTGIDLEILQKLTLHSSINIVSVIPLSDANDVYADAYQLLQFKMDYPIGINKWKALFYLGVDNALNQNYSLGNDINAAGKRYYNPAAERNIFAGIHFQLNK
jgi:iron complex outermembrane receptor protein